MFLERQVSISQKDNFLCSAVGLHCDICKQDKENGICTSLPLKTLVYNSRPHKNEFKCKLNSSSLPIYPLVTRMTTSKICPRI